MPVARKVPSCRTLGRSHCQKGREFGAFRRFPSTLPADGATVALSHETVLCRATRGRSRHQSARCAVGSRRRKLNDPLSEKSKRCVVGSQVATQLAQTQEKA